jgi:hypothetical protein
MKIQINTDRNVQGHEAFTLRIKDIMEHALQRFQSHITRLEIHLSDENADKSGQRDKRCVIEARLEGDAPIVAIDSAATSEQATRQASEKLVRIIDGHLGRAAALKHSPLIDIKQLTR